MNWMEIGFWIFVGLTSWIWFPVALVIAFFGIMFLTAIIIAPFVGMQRLAKWIRNLVSHA